MRTQVVIIGGGPSGLLLSQLLHINGIDSIVLERRSREYVLARIRAGVLESGFVDLLRSAGVAERLDAEGIIHDGTQISFDNQMFRIDFNALIGRQVTIYGQTEVTRDLYDAREKAGGTVLHGCEDVDLQDLEGDCPSVTFTHEGQNKRITCDFVAGCDGFHGVSRHHIPLSARRCFEKNYPFGWLGILSRTPPADNELIYSNSSRGFALCSMRNAELSRYYIQCPIADRPEDWSDQMFWDELRRRIPESVADTLVTGPSVEKSVSPLRSFVIEPMQWGRLYLCGDAAHIVPPTGAKGLNTAASDVNYLFEGLRDHYRENDSATLEAYSSRALKRVWRAERFSWHMTSLLHRFDDLSEFDIMIQRAEFEHLRDNQSAQRVLAENYTGMPY